MTFKYNNENKRLEPFFIASLKQGASSIFQSATIFGVPAVHFQGLYPDFSHTFLKFIQFFEGPMVYKWYILPIGGLYGTPTTFYGNQQIPRKNPSSGPSWKLSTLRDSLLGCCLHRGFDQPGRMARWEDLRTQYFRQEKKTQGGFCLVIFLGGCFF